MNIQFGITAEPIEEQLNKQGHTLGDNPERIDNLMKSIYALRMNAIVTDKEFDRMLGKFYKLIIRRAKKVNRETQIQTD
jgi:hypothetical protein